MKKITKTIIDTQEFDRVICEVTYGEEFICYISNEYKEGYKIHFYSPENKNNYSLDASDFINEIVKCFSELNFGKNIKLDYEK